MTKHNEIQMDKKLRSAKSRNENMKQNVFDSESRSDMNFTVQKDTEVIHREVKEGNEDKLLPEGEPVRILGNTSTEGFGGEKHSEFATRRGSHVMRCVTLTTPAKMAVRRRSSRQSESTNRSSMCVRHCRFWKRPSQ